MNLRQVFYVSRASRPHDGVDVGAILATSRRHNRRADITGCLLFSGRYFGQVLEGASDLLDVRMDRIRQDPRHQDIRLVSDRRVATRVYAEWSMGFLHDLSLEDALEALLLDPASHAGAATVLARLRPDTVMGAFS